MHGPLQSPLQSLLQSASPHNPLRGPSASTHELALVQESTSDLTPFYAFDPELGSKPPEVAASTADFPEVVVVVRTSPPLKVVEPTYELSDGPVTAKEAVYESSAPLIMGKEVVLESLVCLSKAMEVLSELLSCPALSCHCQGDSCGVVCLPCYRHKCCY